MRLLLVSSQQEDGLGARADLQQAGFAADVLHAASQASHALSIQAYDCVLIFTPLPDLSDSAALECVRRERPVLPVIFLTNRASPRHHAEMLDEGADDCLARPIDIHELTARIRSVCRRSAVARSTEDSLTHGQLRLLPSRHSALLGEREVKLTQCEFSVLETLFRRRHQVCSRSTLEDALYGWDEDINSNAVEVYIHYLRRKLSRDVIVTVRGLGYQLAPAPH